MRPRTYALALGAGAALLFLTVAATNLLIDPQGVFNTAVLPVGETSLELITPKGNSGLERFLEKRGPGLHHIAVEVEGIEAALAFLASLGVPLIDTTPRIGARGHKVAFVHPKATGGVLVELVEPAESTIPRQT